MPHIGDVSLLVSQQNPLGLGLLPNTTMSDRLSKLSRDWSHLVALLYLLAYAINQHTFVHHPELSCCC